MVYLQNVIHCLIYGRKITLFKRWNNKKVIHFHEYDLFEHFGNDNDGIWFVSIFFFFFYLYTFFIHPLLSIGISENKNESEETQEMIRQTDALDVVLLNLKEENANYINERQRLNKEKARLLIEETRGEEFNR